MDDLGIVTSVHGIDADWKLENFVKSVWWQKPISEFIMVEYGSEPETARGVKELCKSHGVRYIGVGVDAEKPYGRYSMGVALNIGIKRCMTNYIVSVCADLVLGPHFGEACLEEYKTDPNALITCRHRDVLEDDVPEIVVTNPETYLLNEYDHTVIGASRKWWLKLKGFDERYAGCFVVDNDLVDRAKATGMNWREIHDKADIFHVKHSHRTDQGLPKMFGEEATPNDRTWGTVGRVVDHGRYGLVKLEARPWP